MSTDASLVQKDMQRKRDEEFIEVKKQIQQEAKEHETQMASLRSKHNNLVEELNNQLDQFKRTKTSLGKDSIFINFTIMINFKQIESIAQLYIEKIFQKSFPQNLCSKSNILI